MSRGGIATRNSRRYSLARYVRLKEVTYPDGRIINYDYSHGDDAAIDEVMSRLSAIYDDADDDGEIDTGEDVYASCRYLGAGRIVTEDYEEIQVNLDYTANDFAALDRFGRVETWKRCQEPFSAIQPVQPAYSHASGHGLDRNAAYYHSFSCFQLDPLRATALECAPVCS